MLKFPSFNIILQLHRKGWFSLGVDCRGTTKNSLFLYYVLCAELRARRTKLNRETKNFSRYACNLLLKETLLESINHMVESFTRSQQPGHCGVQTCEPFDHLGVKQCLTHPNRSSSEQPLTACGRNTLHQPTGVHEAGLTQVVLCGKRPEDKELKMRITQHLIYLVPVHVVIASGSVLTRIRSAFVDICLAVTACISCAAHAYVTG